MTKEELSKQMMKEELRIHDEIRKIYPNSAGLDGIVNINDYLDMENHDTNPLKVLWILKERGFPDNKIDEEFKLNEHMKDFGLYPKWKNTYGPMCFVTEGILEFDNSKDEKFLNYSSLYKLEVEDSGGVYYTRDDGEQVFPLDHIAFLNVKKLASSQNTSNQGLINAEYTKPEVKKILQEQFNYINPDIIIMGAHVVKLAEDLAGVPISSYTHVGEYGAHDYYFDAARKKLFIYADHPACRIGSERYSNSIFDIVKKYKKELKK